MYIVHGSRTATFPAVGDAHLRHADGGRYIMLVLLSVG